MCDWPLYLSYSTFYDNVKKYQKVTIGAAHVSIVLATSTLHPHKHG